MKKKVMRKNVLCALTALFFGLMLFGTLFHQKIDRMFRENVSVVSPQSYQEEVMQTWEVNGKKREIITTGTYFLIPKEAVQNNMVYVLETMEVPYGSYEVVRSRLAKEWKDPLPQGIFCGSSMIAHGVIRAFWDAGIHPEDMPKLVAIGNGSEDVDRTSVPSLSVVNLPMEKMAAECLALLLEIMSNSVTSPKSRMLETQYIARESCGPLT